MSKKWLAVMLLLVLVLAATPLLTACSDDDEETTPTTRAQPTATTTPADIGSPTSFDTPDDEAETAPGDMTVTPARLERPQDGATPFVPLGEYLTQAADFNYVEEEWFASGTDDTGHSYATQVFVRRPRDPERFSGMLIVESLHMSGVAPIYMYSSPYILRSGHGWVCIASQKMPLYAHVKSFNTTYYASLHIETDSSSNVILAQVGAALRDSGGPFDGYQVEHVLLVGHSQTGMVTTNFINEAHGSQRLGDGSPVYNGFLPTGAPMGAFGACDVPIIQVISEGDVSDSSRFTSGDSVGRPYRRADSDDSKGRYRLYELTGVPHMGTRYPPMSYPGLWMGMESHLSSDDLAPVNGVKVVMNSLPHHELFDMALDHLVKWVADGAPPPRADRIELSPNGRYFAKDENGNSIGGVRCVQMDVPHSTYLPNPLNPDGTPRWATIGTEIPFDKTKMMELYGDQASYVERFNSRLDELISQGWLLPEDADEMRTEAELYPWRDATTSTDTPIKEEITIDSTIGEIIEAPGGKDVLKECGFDVDNPQLSAAFGLTLEAIAPFTGGVVNDEMIACVDAGLQALRF